MEVEIVPEPPPEEREAIVAALADDSDPASDDPYRSRWRLAGLGADPDQDV